MRFNGVGVDFNCFFKGGFPFGSLAEVGEHLGQPQIGLRLFGIDLYNFFKRGGNPVQVFFF